MRSFRRRQDEVYGKGQSRGNPSVPSKPVHLIDLFQNLEQIVSISPTGIMRLEFIHITDPPDVVALSVLIAVLRSNPGTYDLFA
jgi:hypothetical protein